MHFDPKEIERIFRQYPGRSGRLLEIARRLASLIREADSYIQTHTDAVCPACSSVCCINRHSLCDSEDVIYLFSLGLELSPDASGRTDDEPCRFLGKKGCTRQRHLRPYRCTWYFCTPLLEHMQDVPAPEYRIFWNILCRMTEERKMLADEFSRVVKTVSVLGM